MYYLMITLLFATLNVKGVNNKIRPINKVRILDLRTNKYETYEYEVPEWVYNKVFSKNKPTKYNNYERN